MCETLKGLSNGGPKAAPAAAPVAPVAAVEPTPQPAAQLLHDDPYSDLKRFSDPTVKPVVIPVPAPKAVQAPAAAPAAAPSGATSLFDQSGTLRGYLYEDGKFVRTTSEKSSTSLEHLSEDDRRPIDWEEEKRVDLPQRSSSRIQFLLQHETAAQTQVRIQNDIARYHFGGGDGRALRANPQGRQRNPEAVTPGVSNWGN
jgi:hypothetical protein